MIPIRIRRFGLATALSLLAALGAIQAQTPSARAIDAQLTEVTVERLRQLYAARTYTATEVIQWHLDRIVRYDGLYRAMFYIDRPGALAAAAALDRQPSASRRGALWGVPVVIKANTSIKGLVTSNGWSGYMVDGHEWKAPKDAAIVTRLREAGAVILGHTNMPDFALAETTNSTAGSRTGNAYDWRYSPGGSSGGTATAVSAGFAVIGTGTETLNSIRMPSGASGVVGLVPTRGLVSMAGIHPLDWLLDGTGPIARTVADAAVALDVMAGRAAPVAAVTLKGRRFGVPAFMLVESGSPPFEKETRSIFMKALDSLREAGAEVVIDDTLLPESFSRLVDGVNTRPYMMEGIDAYFREFGPPEYLSRAAFEKAVGMQFPLKAGPQAPSPFAQDSNADRNVRQPREKVRSAYEGALDQFKLDGLVYPAFHTPANDETEPRTAGIGGPHSRTGGVNLIGAPAVVVPAGYYANGLPFGLEFSARPGKDSDLLGWARAYEQFSKMRRPPVLQ